MRELDDLSEEIGAVERLLLRELGDAIEGCSLLESVALLVSQRENARNAHAATKRRCDELELALEDAREFIIGNGGDPCDEAYLEMSKRLGWVIQGEEVK